MITYEGKSGDMNFVPNDINLPFKYVRYLGPSGKYSGLSELEVYWYILEQEDEGTNKEATEGEEEKEKDEKKMKKKFYYINLQNYLWLLFIQILWKTQRVKLPSKMLK